MVAEVKDRGWYVKLKFQSKWKMRQQKFNLVMFKPKTYVEQQVTPYICTKFV